MITYSAEDLKPFLGQVVAITFNSPPRFGLLGTNGEYFGIQGVPGGFLPKHVVEIVGIEADESVNIAKVHIRLEPKSE